ncbi:MAG TPA: hypothetical protein PLU22_02365 [Polyangiaceae bacterium]|nr:hypothetical protein [Polyangiaceae bacterium]
MQTITHRVRSFLAAQGVRIAPWSGLDATYAELHALLARRQDDPEFWGPLERLLRDVLLQATAPEADRRLAAPAAELLGSWDVATLVASLRAALPGAAPSDGAPAYRGFTRHLSPAVLGAFLVLGLAAAGCDEGGNEPIVVGGGGVGAADSGTGGAATSGGSAADGGTGGSIVVPASGGTAGAAGAAACVLEDAALLASTINDSDNSETAKANLCDCMTSLAQSWRDGLTALFEVGTPEEIATALQKIMVCCNGGRNSEVFSASSLLAGTLCEYAVVYKGVVFPG